MKELLARCKLFQDLDEEAIAQLMAIARKQTYRDGEHPFLLGQEADCLFVVLSGKVDICLPLAVGGEMKEIAVESKEAGSALGWSAFASPFRFRLSARAAGPCELAAFPREDLLALFEREPRTGYRFVRRISEVVGERLLTMQALWARELQRAIAGGLTASPAAHTTEAQA
ncbi:MAG: cyclic nucleotide-binding domain-containing protein [Planctomycetota bacterium]|jgi:CRP-like cAMP-binding protein